MKKRIIYSTLSLIPWVLILFFSLMAGCVQDQGGTGQAEFMYVSSGGVLDLPPGDDLELNLDMYVIYGVTFEGKFDITRIVITSGDQRISLDRWLEQSEVLGVNYDVSQLEYILITGNPENFGTLNVGQIHELEQNMFIQVGNDDSTPGIASAAYDVYWRAPLGYGHHGG